ncbi:MAG: hypothetical protein JWN99_2976 [Ilumatobacteraceae bacterium]|nr:hypothetical protein [Ilumatobacteraceae bacterium]
MTPSPAVPDDQRDRGAALILAIAFVVMIGTIGAGLAGLITSSSNNRVSLQTLRNREYAADGAVEEAVAAVRGLDRGSSASCSTVDGTSSSVINNMSMRVDWQAACTVVRGDDGIVVAQRNVIFAACSDTGVPCTDTAVIVRAQVNFRDDGSGTVAGTFVQSWSVTR